MLVQKVGICTTELVAEVSAVQFDYRHNANFKHNI